MSRSGPALFLVALTLAACGTSVTETYINDPPPTMTPRGRHSVLIYASSPPTRPHMDVAILQVTQTRGLNEQGLDLMIDRLRTRAAKLGCDAVVVGGIRERGDSGYDFLNPGATTLHGTCIVFTGKSSPAERAPAPGGECPCRARAAP